LLGVTEEDVLEVAGHLRVLQAPRRAAIVGGKEGLPQGARDPPVLSVDEIHRHVAAARRGDRRPMRAAVLRHEHLRRGDGAPDLVGRERDVDDVVFDP